MLKNIRKKEKGITLIALIITIIVLLILAGVSIATITGENGLLERAKTAKETTDNATNEENNKISQYENEIDNYLVTSRTDSSPSLDSTPSLVGLSVSEENMDEFQYSSFSCVVGSPKKLSGTSKFGTINDNGELVFSVPGLYSVNSILTIISTTQAQIYNTISVNGIILSRSFIDGGERVGAPASTTFYANIGDRLDVSLLAYHANREVNNWKVNILKIM